MALFLLLTVSPSLLILTGKTREDSGFVQPLLSNKDKRCLVEVAYHEARNQGEKGIRAVLQVVKNRKEARGFPDTYCKVVHAPKQFSYRNHLPEGKYLEIAPKKELDKKALQKIHHIVQEIEQGTFREVLPKNALWYTRSEAQRPWMKTLKVHSVIGEHKFFKSRKEST